VASDHRDLPTLRVPGVFRDYTDTGPDGYPPEWHHTIKHAVRDQAGHRCVRCGHPYRNGEHGNGEWSRCDWQCTHGDPIRVRTLLSDTWHELPIAELVEDPTTTAGAIATNVSLPVFVEARWRILTVHHLDGNKTNCRWWNLCALCQRCHLAIQGKVQLARIYPWEHSDWFKPYAAGWYAHAYLGEELTREETLARLDELLALERAA
jgi:hypothetical protein